MSIQIFAMDDMEWWIGDATPEQMRDAWREACGEDAMDDEDLPEPLTDGQLDSLRYYYGDEDKPFDSADSRTFREQLAIEIAVGVTEPRMFACEEW